VILHLFYLAKLKLEYLKLGFKCKKEDKTRMKIFLLTRVRLFSSSAQVLLFEYGR